MNTSFNPADISVAVLLGGDSAEREVSLKSGEAVYSSLKQQLDHVTRIDFDQTGLQQLMKLKPDVVFNVLHGRGGEDGEVQAICDYLKIVYTGSGVKASALTMDKLMTKKLLSAENIATPKFTQIHHVQDCQRVANDIGFPMMIKPVVEGSSIGMSLAKNLQELEIGFAAAQQYGVVMAEQWIDGREFTVAFLGNDILPVIELKTPHEFYDYSAKYEANDTQYLCPCEVTDELALRIDDTVKNTIAASQVEGWGRVDLMCDADEQVHVIEVNTVPGMTDHSLVPMAAKQAGYNFDELVLKILDITWNKQQERRAAN